MFFNIKQCISGLTHLYNFFQHIIYATLNQSVELLFYNQIIAGLTSDEMQYAVLVLVLALALVLVIVIVMVMVMVMVLVLVLVLMLVLVRSS